MKIPITKQQLLEVRKKLNESTGKNIKLTNKVKDILDDETDEKIGEEKYIRFDINFIDGARSFGNIKDKIAYIVSIDAPKRDDVYGAVRGSKTYERVLNELVGVGVKTVCISNQSQDSRFVLKKLVDNNILINPRGIIGLSVDQHPSTFNINVGVLKTTLNEDLNKLDKLDKKALVGKIIEPPTEVQQGLIQVNESPDMVIAKKAVYSDDDAIAFGFLDGKAWVGYNNKLPIKNFDTLLQKFIESKPEFGRNIPEIKTWWF